MSLKTFTSALLLLLTLCAQNQPATPAPVQKPAAISLGELSLSLEKLTARVRPAVVQVFTTSYGPSSDEAGDSTPAGLLTKQRATGSGFLISADGYIITNNHVVENGRRIQVKLPSPRPSSGNPAAARRDGKLVAAKIIGTDKTSDLAVLKIEGTSFPHLALGDSDRLRQGQLVMAFGNPLGLEGSVSMGIVSSVARQLKPDDPMVYVQTDAPINPGNSGGPLIDAEGRVVGVNTFILTQSGGSEGLGFAVPGNVVRTVYQQIKKDGHVHRGQIGVYAQTITPLLAQGLNLPRETGVILSDVAPGGPAATAGVKIGDIVLSVDGHPIEESRQLELVIYRQLIQQKLTLEVLRDGSKLSLTVPVVEREDDPMRFIDLVDPAENLIQRLGILAIPISPKMAEMLPELRFEHGVVVAARTSEAAANGLKPGDVIYTLNRTPVISISTLRATLDQLKPGEPIVLQIQRGGLLTYLVIDTE